MKSFITSIILASSSILWPSYCLFCFCIGLNTLSSLPSLPQDLFQLYFHSEILFFFKDYSLVYIFREIFNFVIFSTHHTPIPYISIISNSNFLMLIKFNFLNIPHIWVKQLHPNDFG